jgi:3-phosphoshikimate 1-carboxyvinyltransferase
MTASIPVIAIDGPTASGKGTLAECVAKALGWHYLDSGALYRLVALRALEQGIEPNDVQALTVIAAHLPVRFEDGSILLNNRDVSDNLRAERVGNTASQISIHAPVRRALLELQHSFRRAPGLVADGRDMGTVIFPDAPLKVFLTANAPTRAERRHKQLINKGFSAIIEDLLADLQARDQRDASRENSPTKPAADAKLLDNSTRSIDECVDWVLKEWRAVNP